jgi:hypothetical protein
MSKNVVSVSGSILKSIRIHSPDLWKPFYRSMDRHSFSKLDADPVPHSLKLLDPGPDLHKVNADPKHWLFLKLYNLGYS